MKKTTAALILGMGVAFIAGAAQASPQDDLKAYQAYFTKKFPDVPYKDYVNGVYSLDKASREQWESIEEFPPYEINIEEGEDLWNEPFANGKGYADCFPSYKNGLRADYPYFDTASGQVKTLELAINECRELNGEKPLKWKTGGMVSISSYLSYLSRGQKINVKIPNAAAAAAYEKGKRHYYSKRGQLNFSCANCHVDSSGSKVRADLLSPGLGQVSHFPVYRSKWGGMGTLHRRYGGCNKQVRAKPFKAQSEEYRNLEYFHTYMSNGLEWNGPGVRK